MKPILSYFLLHGVSSASSYCEEFLYMLLRHFGLFGVFLYVVISVVVQ